LPIGSSAIGLLVYIVAHAREDETCLFVSLTALSFSISLYSRSIHIQVLMKMFGGKLESSLLPPPQPPRLLGEQDIFV
jgi:hypothetical protein